MARRAKYDEDIEVVRHKVDDVYLKHIRLLLDAAKERVNASSDSRFSYDVEVTPAQISKLRNGKTPLSSLFILRIHEKIGLSMQEIKILLSPSIFNMIVWKRAEHGQSVPELHAGQMEVVRLAKQFLLNDGFAILRLGQRSGKQIIVAKILEDLGFRRICIFGQEASILRESFADVPFINEHKHVYYNEIPKEVRLDAGRSLVLIDEPFWVVGSELVFKEARRRRINIIAVGSRGPQWDKVSFWAGLHNSISRSAWECNPLITRESLSQQYDLNTTTARRDFEAF